MEQLLSTIWSNVVKGVVAISGFIMGKLGEWDMLMSVLVCCMGIDYILGVIVAMIGKSGNTKGGGLSSNVGFKGILRKGVIMLMVLLASLVDVATGTDGNTFRTMACLFYITNEGISILENSALAGIPWPEKLKDALELMRNNGGMKRQKP